MAQITTSGENVFAREQKTRKERRCQIVFIIAAVIFILAVAFICIFIFVQAFPAFREIGLFKFLFGTKWFPRWRSRNSASCP